MNNKSFGDILSKIILWGIPLIISALFFGGLLMHIHYQAYPYNPYTTNIHDVHKMVNFNWNIITYTRLHSLLELIYEDPDGKKLLNAIAKNNVHIKITFLDTAYRGGTETISIGMQYIDQSTNIKRGFKYSRYGRNVMENCAVILHEISHAAMGEYNTPQKYKTEYNSAEEELSATMIGLNIASKIYRKHDLTREEAASYIDKSCEAISASPIHSSLLAYNNYIQGVYYKYGITVPYSDLIIQKIREWNF